MMKQLHTSRGARLAATLCSKKEAIILALPPHKNLNLNFFFSSEKSLVFATTFTFLWRLRCPKAEALKVIIWFLSCAHRAKSAVTSRARRAEAAKR
jgi:hypothetical protein